jgi:hypothetical protein
MVKGIVVMRSGSGKGLGDGRVVLKGMSGPYGPHCVCGMHAHCDPPSGASLQRQRKQGLN